MCDIANLYFKRAVELDPGRVLEIREIAKRAGVSIGGGGVKSLSREAGVKIWES